MNDYKDILDIRLGDECEYNGKTYNIIAVVYGLADKQIYVDLYDGEELLQDIDPRETLIKQECNNILG